MMKRILLFLIVLVFCNCSSVFDPEITLIKYFFLYTVPRNYDSEESYPLIIFLHGGGAETRDMNVYRSYGLGEYAAGHKDFPFIVLAPQSTGQWKPSLIHNAVQEMKEYFSIDTTRIYVTGFSMGGKGTYDYAATYPDEVAAIAVVAGYGNTEDADILKDIPIWIFHDVGDPVVFFSEALAMQEAVEDAGGTVKLTIYETNSHSGWYETYTNPELYDWFLQHSLER